MRYHSRTAAEDRHWTAAERDAQHREPPFSVVRNDADEWRDATRDDATKSRRVAGVPYPVDELPDEGDVL